MKISIYYGMTTDREYLQYYIDSSYRYILFDRLYEYPLSSNKLGTIYL